MADRSPLRAEGLRAFINIRAILLDVIRHLEAGDLDSNIIDALYFRLDWLNGLIIRYFDVYKLGEEVVRLTGTARDRIADHLNRPQYSESPLPPRIFLGDRGRPRYLISRDQVEFLLERCFSVVDTLYGWNRLLVLPLEDAQGPLLAEEDDETFPYRLKRFRKFNNTALSS